MWHYQVEKLCWLLNYPWYFTNNDDSMTWLMPVILFQHWSQNNVIYTWCNLYIYILHFRLQNVAWDLLYFGHTKKQTWKIAYILEKFNNRHTFFFPLLFHARLTNNILKMKHGNESWRSFIMSTVDFKGLYSLLIDGNGFLFLLLLSRHRHCFVL